MPVPIGIDLGTTNCCMALMQGKDVVVLADDLNRTTMPSVVAQRAEGDVLVGWAARTCKDPIYRHGFAKRALGSRQTYTLRDGPVRPYTISGYVLRELKRRAEVVAGGAVAAVITVPAHFEAIHKEETLQAAAEAGLEVIDLLQEPIAAAIAYYHQRQQEGASQQDETILVFDLGGGTMDATVCTRRGSHIEVGAGGRAYGGDKQLGGLDFDKKLLALATRQLAGQGFTLGVLGDDLPVQQWLWDALVGAERCKQDLSREAEVHWSQEIVQGGRQAAIDLRLTRPQFEGEIEPLIAQTLHHCNRALLRHASAASRGRAQTEPDQLREAMKAVDRIILVGGSTLVPAIRRRLAEHCRALTGRDVEITTFRPFESVAIGAAIFAAHRAAAVVMQTAVIEWTTGPIPQVGASVSLHPDLAGVSTHVRPGTIELRMSAQTLSSQIGPDGRFQLPPFPLDEGDNEITIAIIDAAGKLVETVPLLIQRQGMSIMQPGLSHAISMRLIEGLIELLPEGTRSGGASTIQGLYLNDAVGVARCPLYEGHSPIGALEFKAAGGPGTPVTIRATYDRGRLEVEVNVLGMPPQDCGIQLEAIRHAAERHALLQRFNECRQRVDYLIAALPKHIDFTAASEAEFQTLRLDVESEFANQVVSDLHRIDDRIRQIEMLEVQLLGFRLTPEGVRSRLEEARKSISLDGADLALLQELNEIEAAIPDMASAEVMEALHGRIGHVRKRHWLKRPPEISEEWVERILADIKLRLESIRRDATDAALLQRLQDIEGALEQILALPDLKVRSHRLWKLGEDFVDPLFHRVVVERSQQGLLRRTAG